MTEGTRKDITDRIHANRIITDDLYTEAEKQYLIGQYEKLETPFYVDYHDGWYQLLENAALLPMLGILIIGYMVAGIFSNEFKWKADTVYFWFYNKCWGQAMSLAPLL